MTDDEIELADWSQRIATWLPRLNDPASASQAAEALLGIRTARYRATKAPADKDQSQASELRLYQCAIAQLEPRLAELIPTWIQRLIDCHRNIQLETDARVAALRQQKQIPKFKLGDILVVTHLSLALQACGSRLDSFLDPIVAAINTLGRDGDDDLAAVLSYAGAGIIRARAALLILLREQGVWSMQSGIRSAMVRLAEFAPSVVEDLKAMLHDPDRKIRQGAASVLGCLENVAAAVTNDLVAMETATAGDRCSAIFALAGHRPATPQVLDLLERALHDKDGYVRRAAAFAIGKVSADPSRFIPQLIAACDDQEVLRDNSLPDEAVLALGKFGPAAAAALPRLREFLDGPIKIRNVKPRWVRQAISAIAQVPVVDADAAVGIQSLKPTFTTSADGPLLPVLFQGRLCYINLTGNIVLRTEFKNGEIFHDDRAIVHSDRRTFVIDREGKTVFESKWKKIKPFHEGLAAIQKNDLWGFVDQEGRIVVEPNYDSVTRFSEGLAGAELGRTTMEIGNYITLDRSGRRGFITPNGTIAIPLNYQDVQPFSQDRSVVCLASTLKANPLVGGRELPSDRRYGLLDPAGNILLDGIYSSIAHFSSGLAAVSTGQIMQRHRFGYIDLAGRVVLPLRFTSAHNFENGLALVKQRGHHHRQTSFLIDRSGQAHSKIERSLNLEGFSQGLAAAEFDGLWGVIDSTGRTVIEPQFDDIGPFKNGIAPAKRGDWNGLIDQTGRFIWGPTTESIFFSRAIEGEWY